MKTYLIDKDYKYECPTIDLEWLLTIPSHILHTPDGWDININRFKHEKESSKSNMV